MNKAKAVQFFRVLTRQQDRTQLLPKANKALNMYGESTRKPHLVARQLKSRTVIHELTPANKFSRMVFQVGRTAHDFCLKQIKR